MEELTIMKITLHLSVALLTFMLGVTLAMVPRAMNPYQLQVLSSRESVLRADLLRMRQAIDRYSAETNLSPRSLNQLVEKRYLVEIPVDPITEKRDWEEVITDLRGQLDVVILEDVHSASRAVSSQGTRYNEW